MLRLAATLALSAPATAFAQSAAPAADAIDPARIASASALIDILMPPSERMEMLEAVLKPMYANIRQSMGKDPKFDSLFQSNPEARKLFDEFMVTQEARSIGTLRQTLPRMIEAMQRAYARRFTVAQMGEMSAFFRTPTGQIYIKQATTIMADPDVQQWQREIMSASLRNLQNDMGGLIAQLSALAKKDDQP
jgi:hypothetical protein